jgi:hypothetical protein
VGSREAIRFHHRMLKYRMVRQLPERWAGLRTILFILCFLLFDRQVISVNTDFWRA